jgi:hypothetical protein
MGIGSLAILASSRWSGADVRRSGAAEPRREDDGVIHMLNEPFARGVIDEEDTGAAIGTLIGSAS